MRKYFVKERGVSSVIANILMILITFLLTIMVLFYAFDVMSMNRSNSSNNYLYGLLNEQGENVSVMITHGSIGTPFIIELKSNSYVFSGTVNSLKNISVLNGYYNGNFSIMINDINHNHLLDAGDIISFDNLTAQQLSYFTLMIIYNNNVVLEMGLSATPR